MNKKSRRAIMENCNDANLEDVIASIEAEDPLELHDGKAYVMAINHSGPCEVKLNPKSYEICAESLLGDTEEEAE